MTVQDLHSITPDHFLEVSGAVIHPLSYQQARNFRFPCGLAYVADPGYMLFRAGVPRHSIIKKVANEDISCLADLISVLSKLSRGARVPLEYMSHTDRHRKKILVKKDPVRRQVLRVKGCLAGSKAENLLEQGDMVLAVNKMPVTCYNDIEAACRTLDTGSHSDENLNLTILRQGREMELVVGTDKRDGNGTTRTINWCGCVVQDPHSAVRALGFLPEEGHGVYVTRWCHGSPAHRYGLYALQWIVEVNGKKTTDLNAFADATKELEHGQFVRIRTVHLNGKPRVLTLKQDLHYWPTWELRFDPETALWRRNILKALKGVNSSRLPNIHYSCRFISSALMAEAIAVRSAVMKAASSNIRSLTVYSDSQVLISMIKTKETRPALYGILFDIFYFSSLFETISFMFIPRLENSEADLVAKSALAAVDNLSVDGV
ncbi:hypothetical protein F2Q69_00039276 [Brassica cretica]|uniref:PDZ domain-containing protein n=1 Tax=Brassica cretica TaxID=69181 RepID=A0A8S9SGX6_BRACR|nr:hypothetical protein F2Q69_00039276 [Brassica cretica]